MLRADEVEQLYNETMPEPNFSLTDKKILVIDDQYAHSIAAMYRTYGIDDISEATTSKQALTMINNNANQFQIILMDESIDDMSGSDLTRKIRASDTPSKNTIIVSISNYRDDPYLFYLAGMNGYLGKNASPTLLRYKLEYWIKMGIIKNQ